jgi:xanthine dehydrogenase molybdenum-binding subunit
MDFLLNGMSREYNGDPELDLLTYLREHEGIKSPKNGCAPQAACGACTVDLNGKAVLSCVIPMKKVANGKVTTIEGLGAYRQGVYANAFAEKGAAQCGFCIPGIVMRANALINQNLNPSPEQIEQALTPNLCRCTGYKKVIEAIQYAAEAIRNEEEIPNPSGDGKIGSRQPKYKVHELVLGQHSYVDDIQVESMVFGALKFSDHPRAVVKRIDTSRAESMTGVLRVFTAADVPGERYIGLIRNDWPLMIAEGETTSYVGDVLAGIVAVSEQVARAAVDALEVEYEVLEPVTDIHAALEPTSPFVHEGGNLLSQTVIRRGDLQAAQEASSFVAQGVYETQMIEHGYMEPEAAIAYPDKEKLTVLSQGQGVYEDQKQIARLLGLPAEKVRVTLVPNGGGFGGKEDLSVQGHAAMMAQALDSPVKVRLTRDESIRMHPKRHPIWMTYNVGCDVNGKLTFVKARFVGDTGAYASVGMKVLERAAGHATGAYHVPVADIEALAVYTNNIPCGAMRGFGVNQAAFGLESCIDELCEIGGFDRWSFRYNNALDIGGVTATGQVIDGGAGIKATLEAVKDQFYAAKYAGLACGIKNTGVGNGVPDAAAARITIAAEDHIIIDHGWTEMGQGVNTVALQVVCNETGLDPSLFEVLVDTDSRQIAGMTTASRATSLVGNALLDASTQLKEDLKSKNLSDLIGKEYQGEWKVDWTTKIGADAEEIKTHYSYSYATQLVILDEHGQIQKVTAAHDAGRIINRNMFEGQIEGAVHMGLGYALSEEMVMENGYPKSTRLRQMGILRAKEMPEVEVIGVEVPDPYGPYGAKGVGEIGLVPTAAAVANALYQFDHERRTRLPMVAPKKNRRA